MVGVSDTPTCTKARTNAQVDGGVASTTTPAPAIAPAPSPSLSPTTAPSSSPTRTPPTTPAAFCAMGVSGVITVSLSKTHRCKEKRQQLFHQEEQKQQTLLKEEPKQPTSVAWQRVKRKQQDRLQDQQQ